MAIHVTMAMTRQVVTLRQETNVRQPRQAGILLLAVVHRVFHRIPPTCSRQNSRIVADHFLQLRFLKLGPKM